MEQFTKLSVIAFLITFAAVYHFDCQHEIKLELSRNQTGCLGTNNERFEACGLNRIAKMTKHSPFGGFSYEFVAINAYSRLIPSWDGGEELIVNDTVKVEKWDDDFGYFPTVATQNAVFNFRNLKDMPYLQSHFDAIEQELGQYLITQRKNYQYEMIVKNSSHLMEFDFHTHSYGPSISILENLV
jgi:hypothetical protein